MCELCDNVKNNSEYNAFLFKMQERDIVRLEYSKKVFSSFPSIFAYSTIEYPKLLIQPMFEPKTAFAAPIAYFQNLSINEEKLPSHFAHGATRSIFFLGKRIIVFSKSTAQYEGEEFFSSFLLAHFEPSEYSFSISPENKILISVNIEKPVKNFLSGKIEKINISFAFAQENLEGKLLRKTEALSSTLFVNQCKHAGRDARQWLNSIEYMFEYVSTVAHFSPHPYLLQLCNQLGYSSQKDFQMKVLDYFRAHFTGI